MAGSARSSKWPVPRLHPLAAGGTRQPTNTQSCYWLKWLRRLASALHMLPTTAACCYVPVSLQPPAAASKPLLCHMLDMLLNAHTCVRDSKEPNPPSKGDWSALNLGEQACCLHPGDRARHKNTLCFSVKKQPVLLFCLCFWNNRSRGNKSVVGKRESNSKKPVYKPSCCLHGVAVPTALLVLA